MLGLMTGGTEGAKDGDNNPRKVLEALLKEVSSVYQS